MSHTDEHAVTGALECRATRSGRTWVVHIPEHGVYGHGRSLKAVRQNVERALALIGVTADITVVAVTPELETLRAAEHARDEALQSAVAALVLRRVTPGDIARATGQTIPQVKATLAATSQPALGSTRPTNP